MATPPRSAADLSLSPPSNRPIGVRAPATMTDPDMGASLLFVYSSRDDTQGVRRRARPRTAHRMRKTSQGVARDRPPQHDGAMALPTHLFTAIDHVGIAVPDLDEAIAFYRDAFGMQVVHEETNQEQGVREAMVAVGDSGSCIQLLAPLNETSTIAKFLDRSGPGLQQLAYRVTDRSEERRV